MIKMKKLFIIFLFASSLFAQVEIGTSTALSSEPENTATLTLKTANGTRTLTWLQMNTWLGVASSLLTLDNAWSGANTYSDKLSVPSSLSSNTTNGVAIIGDDFSWIGNQTLYYGASKAWVTQYVSDEGIAGDLSSYMTKAGNDTVTGVKTINNTVDLRGGYLKLPSRGSYTSTAKDNQLFVYTGDGSIRYTSVDDANDPHSGTLVDSAWVMANVNAVGLKSTGTQTGITSNLTWSGGKVDLSSSDLVIGGITSLLDGELGYDLNQGTTGLWLGISGTDMYIPDNATIEDKLDDIYTYDAPTINTIATDTLNLSSDRNYIARIYQPPQSALVISISDAGEGVVSFSIEGGTQSSITITSLSGLSIIWDYGDTPTFPYSSGRIYDVVIRKHNSTTDYLIGSYKWAE